MTTRIWTILLASVLATVLCPTAVSADKSGTVGGTVGLVSARTNTFINGAPRAKLLLNSGKQTVPIPANEDGDFGVTLRVGTYCLQRVEDENGNLLTIYVGRAKCFTIRPDHHTRFDVVITVP
jgi:hypothetical protein